MFSTTITPPATENIFGDGTYTIDCTCGEHIAYQGKAFTQVEAQRHQAWHAKQAPAALDLGDTSDWSAQDDAWLRQVTN